MMHSGKFLLRIPPTLHQKISNQARKNENSLNRECIQLLERGLSTHEQIDDHLRLSSLLSPLTKLFRRHFSGDILGLLAFGSRVSGLATETSDLDLLIVLSDGIRLERSLYTLFDAWTSEYTLPFEVSPHFVHLPENPETAGSLWLEVAENALPLWERDDKIQKCLNRLQSSMQKDKVRKLWSNGHAYWVKN